MLGRLRIVVKMDIEGKKGASSKHVQYSRCCCVCHFLYVLNSSKQQSYIHPQYIHKFFSVYIFENALFFLFLL